MTRQFSRDYGCSIRQVNSRNIGYKRFKAWGCGKVQVYTCGGNQCVAEGSEAATGIDESRDYQFAPSTTQPRAANAANQETVSRTQAAEGYLMLQATTWLSDNTWLRLVAAPEREPDRLLFEIRTATAGARWQTCQVRAMADLNVMPIPPTTHVRLENVEALRVALPALALFYMVRADQTKLRICDDIITPTAQTRSVMTQFLLAFIEERRWLMGSSSGSQKSSGTYSWTGGALTTLPPVKGPRRSPAELYKQLAPSVFQVWSCDVVERNCAPIGSAVAVSATRLLTNAHVSEETEMLRIQGEGRELEVRVLEQDSSTDRAILELVGKVGSLTPVPGVRSFASIRVGETVLAIGSPKGLDDTLSTGIISSIRSEFQLAQGGFTNVLQTSAPVSPGSSGGGLFDERGNLLGITTETAGGQNLNFAIAAESFFRQ